MKPVSTYLSEGILSRDTEDKILDKVAETYRSMNVRDPLLDSTNELLSDLRNFFNNKSGKFLTQDQMLLLLKILCD